MSGRDGMAIWMLVVLLLVPGVQSLVSTYAGIWPKVTFPLFKGVILAVPFLVWLRRGGGVGRGVRELGLGGFRLLPGLATGVLLGGAVVAGYCLWLRGTLPAEGVVNRLAGFGLDSPGGFFLMGALIAFSNSALEEFYWRGFLFAEWGRRLSGTVPLCLVGGLGFGVHHFFITASFFSIPVALLLTGGTAVAGAVWCWQRTRGHSLLDCYLSHIVADVAVLWCGWDLIAAGLRSG